MTAEPGPPGRVRARDLGIQIGTYAPGRFNVMDYRGATVIADYGHNPDAMRALVDARVDALPNLGHWTGGAARWDWDQIEQILLYR